MGSILQSDNPKRFSMCNCITLGFKDTYTAHALTMNMFLWYALPGCRIPMPYTNMWPNGYLRVLKVPTKIDTFLFSTFNEVLHPSYHFEDGCRIHIGPNPGCDSLKKIATSLDLMPPYEFSYQLKLLEEKVEKLWSGCKKILVFYDTKRASDDIKRRFEKYNNVSINTLKWASVQMIDTGSKKELWQHYLDSDREILFRKIEKIENFYSR